ncbi:MAG: TetR/AcrR family transcriptional regulator [Clostridiales bacterium]|nr:TetR/AcrR family transcriptional regulator [Clostridiales bacterium]
MGTFNNISEVKRERIINMVIKEFGTYGYAAASTNRIVKNLGVSKGSLFKYFSTKLDLYSYMVTYASENLLDYMKAVTNKSDTWQEKLLNYASREFDYLMEEPDLYKFFRQVIKDIELVELISIKTFLMEKSSEVYKQLYETLGLSLELYTHISYVLTGYNEWFFLEYDGLYNEQVKKKYLEGIKMHLNYIKV